MRPLRNTAESASEHGCLDSVLSFRAAKPLWLLSDALWPIFDWLKPYEPYDLCEFQKRMRKLGPIRAVLGLFSQESVRNLTEVLATN